MSDAIKLPGRRERKPAKAAPTPSPYEGFAFPKPVPRRPPKEDGQHRRSRINPKREGRRGDPNPPAQAFAKPAGRAYDTPFMLEVKKQPCLLKRFDPTHRCDGRVQADHAGVRPRGRKCDDRKTLPFCPSAHGARERFLGFFKTFDKASMRVWLDARIEEMQAKLAWVPVAQEAA